MPRELRTIIFEPGEVHAALTAFATRQKMPMPTGQFDSLSFDAEAEPALTLSMRTPGNPVARQVSFRKAEVAAALILLCRELHVPLPKDCRKNLISLDGQPAFRIELP